MMLNSHGDHIACLYTLSQNTVFHFMRLTTCRTTSLHEFEDVNIIADHGIYSTLATIARANL